MYLKITLKNFKMNNYKLNKLVWTACVTPFDASGENIDYLSLENLLKIQEKANNGILICGSTGESLALKDEERYQLVKFATNLNLNVPIMVGVPSHNFYHAIEFIEFCNNFPISGYLMSTPIYSKAGIIGQTQWFSKLIEKSNFPVMLYNIPSRAGSSLYPETIQRLSQEKKLWAIKESNNNTSAIPLYKQAASDVLIFCGDDNMMPQMADDGAFGLVSVASNAWPNAVIKYVDKSLKNRKLVEKVWIESTNALFSTSNPVPIKALLYYLGVINHPTVRLPLSLLDIPSIEQLKLANYSIKEWEINN